ncbi:MAG TPA: polysaccharide deacetylase family protein [Thermoplasmata archaeon]|nr:polysaccharide deacetylase family protein [Thermoplasmata archaeon]
MIKNPAVPVIMYHSIGIPNRKWQWNYLTCPYEIFESQLKWVKEKAFHTISLQRLYDYMKEDVKLLKNPVVLTFDDGYLDNWVFAYPLLKKYGFKGTIYVNPEFTDPRNIIRKNLEDVWKGEAKIDKLETIGYLSWKEMKEMEDEGVMDIQSHTLSHTWYPTSNRIIDFRHPRDPYIWMTWNDNPAKKPYLQIDNEELVNYGEPVCEYGRATGTRRYFPDEILKEFMKNYVEERSGKDFFDSKNWRDELFEVARKYKEENWLNERYETEEEYEERVYYELKKSKEIIEHKLDKEAKFLCWPGGAVTDKALKMASDIGYVSSTAGRDMKYERKYLRNKYEEDPSRINRRGSALYWDGIEGFGSKVKYMNGFYFALSLYNFQGRKIVAPISRLILATAFIRYKIITSLTYD